MRKKLDWIVTDVDKLYKYDFDYNVGHHYWFKNLVSVGSPPPVTPYGPWRHTTVTLRVDQRGRMTLEVVWIVRTGVRPSQQEEMHEDIPLDILLELMKDGLLHKRHRHHHHNHHTHH